MNIAQMLSTGPTLKTAHIRTDSNKSAANIAAADSMREASNKRYHEAFSKYQGGIASTVQVANALGQCTSGTGKQLTKMSKRENPVVKKVGEIPHARNGNPTNVWQWIES